MPDVPCELPDELVVEPNPLPVETVLTPDPLDPVTELPPDAATVHDTVTCPDDPYASFAVTTTDEVPAAVGVPVIAPVDAPIDKPAGNPVAEYVNDSFPVSLAATCIDTAEPTTDDNDPGFATVTTGTGQPATVNAPDEVPVAPD